MPAGENSSTRTLWQSNQQSHLGASRRNGRSENFACQYLTYLKGSLTARKILHGTSGCTCHPRESMLRIFDLNILYVSIFIFFIVRLLFLFNNGISFEEFCLE
jgi:hypothetical protein